MTVTHLSPFTEGENIEFDINQVAKLLQLSLSARSQSGLRFKDEEIYFPRPS